MTKAFGFGSLAEKVVASISGSRAGRYWLNKLSNHEALLPLFNIIADRHTSGFRLLNGSGWAPDIVVDIGANVGDWTRAALPCLPQARFIMIEAQPHLEAHLQRLQATAPTRISYAVCLLGRERKDTVDFYLANTGSSLYVEGTAAARTKVSLPMETLDAVLARYDAAGPTFLKLDVQGAELDVLAGASATLARTDAILMEASLVEYNIGAPRIADVVARMRELDFLPFDIWDLRRIGPVLAQIDLVFARRGSPLETYAQSVIRSYGGPAIGS